MGKIKPKKIRRDTPTAPSRGAGCVVLMVLGMLFFLIAIYLLFKNLAPA